jgi:CBS domain-containing protein
MYVDDAVDMMEELPANVVKRVMRNATSTTRALINQYLKYPENSAGSIMTAEFVDLKKYMNVRESIARIRRIGEDKETIYVCYVTSGDRKLEGVVTVKDLLLSNDDDVIEDIMDTNIIFAIRRTTRRMFRDKSRITTFLPSRFVTRKAVLLASSRSTILSTSCRKRSPRTSKRWPVSPPRTNRTPAPVLCRSGRVAYPG